MEEKWFLENNIQEKLRVAVETLAASHGWQVLEGLEAGEVTVKIKHDGNSITFLQEKGSPTESKIVTHEEQPKIVRRRKEE